MSLGEQRQMRSPLGSAYPVIEVVITGQRMWGDEPVYSIRAANGWTAMGMFFGADWFLK